ncbi:MAG: acyl-CoA dehydrogenase family protein [Desulfomonilia bacterium]|jgi:butyryl-CoA dehydrogenase|uniref:Acyl-CoA dehydrogenase n=1 Tax=anaerobic digester metagenome TaxID=1263854 RepID=A0A485M5P1_9ZZZZ|nr:acyl-CoA dehydrogenase family protein [Pseudomonadota bacterium]HON37152.1 acyl-CoA dehydrogenase family protein [Deltaproteobacteria bacterium]HRS54938.1 acyl-CoA dehydrogenase family protein [Desulfomonilia bacterium]HPD20090.1 acyl-CoA dehydrogenase family protein [Deltaproteobacteria bacterium]HPX17809.1 acyl-CoA dehydrogenase family protein [Deltaproteobacteria bacterium]
MAFQLTAEQEMVRLMARDFARKELEPSAALREKEGVFPLDVVRKMGGLGLLGMMVPTEYGGSDAGAVSYCLALEEIASACASTAVTMSVANLSTEPLLKFGDESQKQRYLVPLASGKALGCFAVTEPGAGSDPGGLMLKAEEKGGCYLLNGTKVFITHGEYADVVNLVARTGPDKGNKGLSAFVVEKGTPGFSVGKREDKMGLRASNTVELVFEDCLVPAENLVGRPGQGFKIAMTALDSGRIGIASQAVGIARACLKEALEYARQRRQFGRSISSFQAIQWAISDMATGIEAAHLLTLAAADDKDHGLPFTQSASMAKLFASEMANRAAYQALQIHGGYGYMKEFKVERLYRDARATTIYEGTSEIQRLVIARELLRG